jgi:hypothetical protein
MRALCVSTAPRSTRRSASICSRLFAIVFTYLPTAVRSWLRTIVVVQMGREAVIGDRDVDLVPGLPYSAKRRRSGPGRSSRVTRSPAVAASPAIEQAFQNAHWSSTPCAYGGYPRIGIPPGRSLLKSLTVARIPRVPHQKSRCERPLAERRYGVTLTPNRVRPTVRSVPGRRG